MATECYAMLRGSALRVTTLTPKGALPGQYAWAPSKCVSRVEVNESSYGGGLEVLKSDSGEGRLGIAKSNRTLGYEVNIAFIRVDPGILNLVSAVPVTVNSAGDIAGFDGKTRLPTASFALEVWSELGGQSREGGKQYGYTLFPFLKGGRLSGFSFANGLVSFKMTAAKTQRGGKWGVGPHDVEGVGEPLGDPVSGNVLFRNYVVGLAPPAQCSGQSVADPDAIDGGTASSTSADILDGEFVSTSGDIVDGGTA